MKVLENVTLYKCDHCSKKMQRKHAMVNHEVKCSQNPKNIRACFDCSYCEKVKIKYEPDVQGFEDNLSSSHSFKCLSKDVLMFPPKLEHSEHGVPSYVEYNGEEIIQEKMPTNCEIKNRSMELFENMFNTL